MKSEQNDLPRPGRLADAVSAELARMIMAGEIAEGERLPTERDLMDQKNVVDDRTVAFSTGSWGDDSRDYHLCIHADPAGRRSESRRPRRYAAARILSRLRLQSCTSIIVWLQ